MKRERELKIEHIIKNESTETTRIYLKGDYDYDNLKVILTEEVYEYVEVLRTDYPSVVKVGEVCKIDTEISGLKGGANLKCKINGFHDTLYFRCEEYQPSTKEAYDAQFKVKKVSIAKLEKKYGCKIEIVK
tara:strand:+ start:907 stop:1299 length:393 start_codon:yes stop_codon:yes gene_type:complete